MVWIAAILGALFGILQAKKRKGKPLDMVQYGTVFGIVFAIVALIINIAIIRMGAG